MASPAAVLSIIVTANTTQAQAGLARVDRQLKTTQATALSTGSAFQRAFGRGAAVGTVLALGAATAYSLKKSIEWEQAFADVRKTVSATEPQFDAIAAGLRNLSTQIPVSAEDLAHLAGEAGALGIRAKDLVEFTKVAAGLGEATDLSAEDAATALARIGNVMGATRGDYSRMASTLVDLGNKGASTESEIANMSLRFIGVAKQVGLSKAQVLGFSAALANVGEEAEAGGSAISRAFIEMTNAVSEGGSRLDQFAKVAGVSSAAFSRAYGRDPARAMTSFIEGLNRIDRNGGNVFKTLDKLGLGEIRVRRALLSLAGGGHKLADALGIADKAWGRNNALTQETNQRYKTTASRLSILKNRIDEVARSLGDKLKPAFDEALGAMNKAFKGKGPLADMFETAKGPLGTLVEGAQKGLAPLIGTIKGIGPAIGPAFRGIRAAIEGNWGEAWDNAKTVAIDSVKGAFQIMDTLTGGKLSGFARTVSRIGDKVKGIAGKGATIAIGVGGDAVGKAKSLWGKVKGVVSRGISFVVNLPSAAFGLAKRLWSKVKGAIEKGISFVINLPAVSWARAKAQAIWDAVNDVIDTISVDIDWPDPPGWLSKLAVGTSSWKGGPAYVNERGAEMARYPNGSMGLLGGGQRGKTLTWLPEGTKVYPAGKTAAMLSGAIPGFASGGTFKSFKSREGQIAKMEDRVTALTTMYGFLSSQAGAELSPTERAKLISENEDLQDTYRDQVKLINRLLPKTKRELGADSRVLAHTKNRKRKSKFRKQVERGKAQIAAMKEALIRLQGASGIGGTLLDVAGVLDELKGTSATGGTDAQALADLYRSMFEQSQLRYAVSQRQYGALPFAGSFAKGGIVPGPVGQARMAVVHGGETITPQGITVVIEDGAVDPRKIRVIAADEAQKVTIRNSRSTGRVPGRAGSLRG